jgi:aminoglycoside phosphotransferase (APT) family kinase protein
MTRPLPQDPALPQLAQALDPHAMARAFGAALSGWQVRGCEVERIKYRPGRNCTVLYRLNLCDARRGDTIEQRIAARFFSGGESARRHVKAAERATVASAAGPALMHLGALDMLAHCWPNDAKLDALGAPHSDATLRELVAALTEGRGRLIDQRSTVVQYVPELRACVRVELRLQADAGAPITTQTVYAKIDIEHDGAAVHALLQALYASLAQHAGRLRTPRPVLWQAATGWHWQLAVPGRALLDVDPLVGAAASARVGARLAALHATPLPALPMLTAQALRAQPRQVAQMLAQVEPAWQPLLARLVDRLEDSGAALEREPAVTLHGDLHPRNILVDGETLAFIDLDGAHLGPAVIELGAWVADAMCRAQLGGIALPDAAPAWRAFLAAYARASGCSVEARLLAWCTAHHLLCQRAYRAVANLKAGRFEGVPALLALADSIAGAGTVEHDLDLDTCTDVATMRALLQAQLPGYADGGLRIDALRVGKARRNTSLHRNPNPITLCYELQVSDPARGRAGTQRLYAQVFRAGLAEPFYRQQDRSRLAPPAFGNALVLLPELNMVLWALPNDPGLPQLVTLLDPAYAVSWAALGIARSAYERVQVELLRYEPQRRASLRYTLARRDGGAARTLYAKTFCDGQAEDIHRRFGHFWQLAHPAAPLVAQPLAHCAETRTVWQAPAPGTPLLAALDSHDGAALMGGVARALVLLHDAPLALSAAAAPRSVAHWVAEVRRRQNKIGRAAPALAARVEHIADAIAARAGPQAARPLGLIHGDFHPEQVWVHEGRIVLFDFDEFTLGDPMEDLAEFVTKLEQAGTASELGSVLIDRYAACAPHRFDARSLAWHLAVQGLLQASRAFVFQQPGWPQELERRLARCEARVAALTTETTR